MKIIDKTKNNITMNDIDCGSVFLFRRIYYMKVAGDHTGNCVDLTNGELVYLACNAIITPVNATIVIE